MDECIEWQGCRKTSGYGSVRYEGKVERAHRVAYCRYHGIPLEQIKGMHILHSCDNPPCVNPNHLTLGTHSDNMKDKMAKGRHRAVQGEAQGASKLTNQIVKEILSVYIKSHRVYGASALAKKYGVNPSTIQRIIDGVHWTHIEKDN